MASPHRHARCAGALVACALTLGASASSAAELRTHFEVAAAHFVGDWQGRELGFGGVGAASLELGLGKRFGLEARMIAGGFTAGSAPRDPSFAPNGAASLFGAGVGARSHPLADLAGAWIGAGLSLVRTGSRNRPELDLRLGYDFRPSDHVELGPFVGYLQVLQPDQGDLRGEDARAWMIGLHLGFDEGLAAPRVAKVGPPAPTAIADCAHGATNDPSGRPCAPPEPVAIDDACKGDACSDGDSTVRVVGDEIVLDDLIYFDFDVARVRLDSVPLMRAIAKLIAAHPEYSKIHVLGHTDEIGTEDYNQRLSEQRAEAVRTKLIELGIPAERLGAAGYGESRPRVARHDEAARQANRRVEFLIERTMGGVQ